MPLPDFTATNKQTALDTYIFRRFYKENAYPEFGPRFIDYWYDKSFYGRVDREERVVVPRTDSLKQIRTNSGTYLGVNFVVDAFEELKSKFEHGALRSAISRGGVYSALNPTAAWSNATNLYFSYLDAINDLFLNSLNEDRTHQSVRTFEDFSKRYIQFFNKILPALPITKSGFVISKFCSPMVSGLTIELGGEDHATDLRKQKSYIEDVNFEVFRNTAAKFGFIVDKNAPWRLTAELASPRMQFYSKNYNTTYAPGSASDIFETLYTKTYEEDIDLLKSFLFSSYEEYVDSAPVVEELKESKCGKNPFIHRSPRKTITESEYEGLYGEQYWLKLYFRIRLRETGVVLHPAKLKVHLNQISGLHKALGHGKILHSLNERILDLNPERWWIKGITSQEEYDILHAVSSTSDVTLMNI